jgi:hypothetical protein
MSALKLVVNGQTLMDGDLGEWRHKPPTSVQHLLQPGKKPQPYMQAALMALMEAAIKDVDTTIKVRTKARGWTIDVTHAAAIVVAP